MVQYDQTAWVKNGSDEAIGILSTNTDMGLTALQVQLVAEYLDLPAVVFKFTWGDSDQYVRCTPPEWILIVPLSSSWIARGYPASCLSEGLFENMNIDNIHTPNE
jgi:leucyl aminopeptidase